MGVFARMIEGLKDWRRVATRYDRCAKTFLSAVALAATVMFWLSKSMSLEPSAMLATVIPLPA